MGINNLSASLESGVITGRIDGSHMDAAVAGSTAGLEVSLERGAVRTEYSGPRARDLMLTLDMEPSTMRELAVLLAIKSGMPAFNEGEWRQIWNALERDGHFDLSRRISEAYGWTA